MKWKGMKQGTEGFLRRHWSGYVSLALVLMLFVGLLPQAAMTARASNEGVLTLDASSQVDFGTVASGYRVSDFTTQSQDVTITNTGDVPVTLEIELSDETAFSKSTAYDGGEIAATSGTATVTVAPKTGQAVGTYIATLTVTATYDDNGTATKGSPVTREFTYKVETASYDFTLSDASVDFNGGNIMYEGEYEEKGANSAADNKFAEATITITGDNNKAFKLNDPVLTQGSEYFELGALTAGSGNLSAMENDKTATFTINPKTTLTVGDDEDSHKYEGTVTVSNDRNVSKTIAVEITVTKKTYTLTADATDGKVELKNSDGKNPIGTYAVADYAQDVVLKNEGNHEFEAESVVWGKGTDTPFALDSTAKIEAGDKIPATTGNTKTIKIQPKNTSLTAADSPYTDTLTITGTEGDKVVLNVTFAIDAVDKTLEGTSSKDDGKFDKRVFGYETISGYDASEDAITVTLENKGNTAVDVTNFAFETDNIFEVKEVKNDGATVDASAYPDGSSKKVTVAAGKSLTVELQVVDSLDPASAANASDANASETFTDKFTITADPADPSATSQEEQKFAYDFSVEIEKTAYDVHVLDKDGNDITTPGDFALDFGEALLDYDVTTIPAQSIKIYNAGNTKVSVTAVEDSASNFTVTTSGAQDYAAGMKAADATEIKIQPKQDLSTGTQDSKIKITYKDPANNDVDIIIPLKFKVNAKTYKLTADNAKIAFPEQAESFAVADVAAQTVTITNEGNADVTIAAAQVTTKNNKFNIKLKEGTYPVKLAEGESATFEIVPAATEASATTVTDTITFSTQENSGNTVKVDVEMEVKAEAKEITITEPANDATLQIEKQEEGYTDANQGTIKVKNTGNATLNLTVETSAFYELVDDAQKSLKLVQDEEVEVLVRPIADLGIKADYQGTVKFTDDADDTVTATARVTFGVTAKQFDITVTTEAGGSSTAKADPEKAAAGDEITLTATAANGYEFVKWEVTSDNTSVADETAATTKINRMPGSAVELKAIFKETKKEEDNSGNNGNTDSSNNNGNTDSGNNGATTPSTPNAQGGWKKNNTGWWFKYDTVQNGKAYPRAQWEHINNKWYHFDSEGYMETGWLKAGGKWYYLDPKNGDMKTGWIKDGGVWYYLNTPNGDMKTGWLKEGDLWYYLKGNGAMATGWQKVNGKWYYLNTKSGAMQTGWLKDGGVWYYLQGSGAMKTGWLQDNGTWYYLQGNGAMLANTSRAIGGKTYNFNASGACTNPY